MARKGVASGAWSPDGEWIVYTADVPVTGRDLDDNDVSTIFIMRKDGTGKRRVAPIPKGRFGEHDYNATFSPDGKKILFESDRGITDPIGDTRLHIYIINTDGTGFKRLIRGSEEGKYDSTKKGVPFLKMLKSSSLIIMKR